MKSPPGFRTSLALSLFAVTVWPRTSQGQEPPNSGAGPNVPATTSAPAAAPPTAASPSAPGVIAAPLPSNGAPGPLPVRKWYDAVKVEGFVDAYANVSANSPKPQSGQNLGRNFDVTNGFALHWAGLNAS